MTACGVSCVPILLLCQSKPTSQDSHCRNSGIVTAFECVRPQIGNQGGEVVRQAEQAAHGAPREAGDHQPSGSPQSERQCRP
jgi:hypothetical protein